MRRRLVEVIVVAAVIIGVVALLRLGGPRPGQTSGSDPAGAAATPWGEPDLQGYLRSIFYWRTEATTRMLEGVLDDSA